MNQKELRRAYMDLEHYARFWANVYGVEMEDVIQECETLKLENRLCEKFLRPQLSKHATKSRNVSIDAFIYDDNHLKTFEEIIAYVPQDEDFTIDRVLYALRYWRDTGIITDGQAVAIYHRVIDEWSFNRIDKEYKASHDKARRNFLRGIERLQKFYSNLNARWIRNEFHFFSAM